MAEGPADHLNPTSEGVGRRRPLILFLLLLAFVPADDAADALFHGQSLSGRQILVSKGEAFELGFFRPGKSTSFYVGIWYRKLKPQTVVWVANREAPVSNASACQFKISHDGRRLVLLHTPSSKVLWSSSLRDKSISTSSKGKTRSFSVLHDDGNLMLHDSKGVLWQSFDHPTDTQLPGSWFGRNNTTGEIQKLVSWKSYDDPAPGRFSFGLQPGRSFQYFLTWSGTENYWTTGLWNGKSFDNIPEMEHPSDFNNYTFVDNEGLTSFCHGAMPNILTREVLDSVRGQLQQWYWLDPKWVLVFVMPKRQCQVYALCGYFGVCEDDSGGCRCIDGFEPASPSAWRARDWSDGCTRTTPLRCGATGAAALDEVREDNFKALPNMRLPANPRNISDRDVSREQDCKLACLGNTSGDCSCTAYSFENRVCSIWVGELLNLQQLADGDTNGGTLHLRLEIGDMLPKKSRHREINKVVVLVGSAVAVVVLVLSLLWLCKNRNDRRALNRLDEVDSSLVMFSYRHLQSATKNFSEELGAGGFGSVFRGVLSNASAIAVKKLALLQQGEKQFRAEVSTLGKIQHVNLVRLRGFCCSGAYRMLVYDFMPNGSLDRHMFDESSKTTLSWRTRYGIMVGVACGLAYLHEDCNEQIVHCDVKPENILLDADFCPKVADFGMAKLIGRDFSRALTTMRGTRGYLAPEWIAGLPITPKVDVYSYGMMLLELVSGKRNRVEVRVGDADVYRPLWAASIVSDGRAPELVDPMLEGNFDEEEMERACRVACWCIQDHEDERPSMRVIVKVLRRVADLGTPPIPKSLLQFNQVPTTAKFFTECSSLISNMYPSYSY